MSDFPSSPKRSPGGQPGNTNAVKHGYYSHNFHPSELEAIASKRHNSNLRDEIELLRILLRRVAIFASVDENIDRTVDLIKVVTQATTSLGHLLRLQAILTSSGQDKTTRVLEIVIQQIREANRAIVAARESGQLPPSVLAHLPSFLSGLPFPLLSDPSQPPPASPNPNSSSPANPPDQ